MSAPARVVESGIFGCVSGNLREFLTLSLTLTGDGTAELDEALAALRSRGYVSQIRFYRNPHLFEGTPTQRQKRIVAMSEMPPGFGTPLIREEGGVFITTASVELPVTYAHIDSIRQWHAGIVASQSADLEAVDSAIRPFRELGRAETAAVLSAHPSWVLVRHIEGPGIPTLLLIGTERAASEIAQDLLGR